MTTFLEEELVAGMREQTAGLRPAADLVERAARGHRRRTARAAVGSGALGAAVVVAVAVATLGGGPAAPPTAEPEARSGPSMLSVAEVSQLAVAALATDDVEHVLVSSSQNRAGQREEFWYDPVTGSSRHHAVQALPGDRLGDTWSIRRDGQVTVTYVNHSSRSWWTADRPASPGKTASQVQSTPEELRAALSRGDGYRLVGTEKIDGRAVLHLREEHAGGTDDLWVDKDSYRAVRRVIVKFAPAGDVRIQLDFEWLPRTDEALAPLTVSIPSGYAQVDPSEGATPAAR